MKKTCLMVFLLLFVLCAVSCERTMPPDETFEVSVSKTDEEIVTTQEKPPATTTVHTHNWLVFSLSEANCSSDGKRVWSCGCGAEKEDVLPRLSHVFEGASCGKASVCKRCGLEGAVGQHYFEGNTCTKCKTVVRSPIFVLDTALEFDEPAESVIQKLGSPTEILTEGDMRSLVYASSPSRLTVVQTDSVGLWGVFTFDSSAFFQIEGECITSASFSGKDDEESDAFYRDVGSCRIYGFRDGLGTGENYALWMRYSECEYHYMLDQRISQNYYAQSRLSFHYVNALRAISGFSPLTWSTEAAQVSQDYAQTMAQQNFFQHDGLYGTRLNSAGIVWRSCGENISQGYTSALFVCDAYYNCLDHRNNILNTSFTYVGMGYYLKSDAQGPLAVMGAQTFYS